MIKINYENISDQEKLLHAAAIITAVASNLDNSLAFVIDDDPTLPLHERLMLIASRLNGGKNMIEEYLKKELAGDDILEQNLLFLDQFTDDIKSLYRLATNILDVNKDRTDGSYAVICSQLNTLELVIFKLSSTYDINVSSLSDKLILKRYNGNTKTLIKHAPILDPMLLGIDKLHRISQEWKAKG